MFIDNYLPTTGDQYDGNAIAAMQSCRFDSDLRRPYFDPKLGPCVTVNTGRMRYDEKLKTSVPIKKKMRVSDVQRMGINNPVLNATTLRKDEWIRFDQAVLKEARGRLMAWTDLASRNSFGGFNGMAKTILEHETMSDVGQVQVDMDGMTEGRADRPVFQLEGLPLPITHCDFWFSERELAVSRTGSTPLDTAMAEMAGRRVAEQIEKTLIGITAGVTFGSSASGSYGQTSKVYGYTSHPLINTKTDITTPTGANPDDTLADVLAMRDTLYGDNMFGPFMLYHSNDWDQFMDNDYFTGTAASGLASPSVTLRERLRRIQGIIDVKRLDFWTPSTYSYQLLLVQMTSDVARAIIGMDIRTVQWDSMGGMRKNFKVMAILVPQIRATYAGNSGIILGSTAAL